MPAGAPQSPQIRSADVKLLRVFMAVAESGSYAGAQSLLNVSAATISTQMSALESRLNMRLCSRGRAGFRLTEAGSRVLDAAQRLFAAHDEFSSEIWLTGKRQQSILRLGVVDNVISNSALKLSAAIRQVCDMEGPIEIHFSTLSPSEIEQGVLRSELDMGIGVFLHRIPGLHYEPFLTVDLVLCCGRDHPAFERAPLEMSLDEVTTFPYVTRSYMGERSAMPGVPFRQMGYTQSEEASALLVLSGHYIGHLPRYYAEPWIETGQMRIIQHERLGYTNRFAFAVRDAVRPTTLVKSLSELLVSIHNSPT